MDKKNDIELTRVAFISTDIIIYVIGLLLMISTMVGYNEVMVRREVTA
jgi:hypothetical protein